MRGEISDGGFVTTMVSRRAKPGREQEFEDYVNGIVDASKRFPGHMGANVFRPTGSDNEWQVVFTFNSRSNLQRWLDSDERREWYERAEEISHEGPRTQDITDTSQGQPLRLAILPFERFARTHVSSTGLLLAATLMAILLANSPLANAYEAFFETELSVKVGPYSITESLLHWINDALMALFFLVVGLEIKRELLVGRLSTFRLAALPIFAALGGMILPAAIYTALNLGGEGASGWGVPIASDIAFALGVLIALGDRVPVTLRIFLAALAIADDIGAVMVIALFYTEEICWSALLVAAILLAALIVANRAGAHHVAIYAVLGVGVWLAVFESGMHATVAGILAALTVPSRAWINAGEFVSRGRDLLSGFENSCGREGTRTRGPTSDDRGTEEHLRRRRTTLAKPTIQTQRLGGLRYRATFRPG